jgi:hypothetical protein
MRWSGCQGVTLGELCHSPLVSGGVGRRLAAFGGVCRGHLVMETGWRRRLDGRAAATRSVWPCCFWHGLTGEVARLVLRCTSPDSRGSTRSAHHVSRCIHAMNNGAGLDCAALRYRMGTALYVDRCWIDSMSYRLATASSKLRETHTTSCQRHGNIIYYHNTNRAAVLCDIAAAAAAAAHAYRHGLRQC